MEWIMEWFTSATLLGNIPLCPRPFARERKPAFFFPVILKKSIESIESSLRRLEG